MLTLFRNLKIAEKLLLTELAMTLSMLLVFSIFALGNHYHNLRSHLTQNILLQMNVVGTSIGPAVMLGELGSAANTLAPLSDNENIRTIILLDQQQHTLESLHPQHDPMTSAWQWLYPFFRDMELSTPISVDEKTVGTLRVIIKQEQVVDMLVSFAWSNTIAAIAAALCGYFIMWRLNRYIVDPIHALQRFVSNITQNHHYDQRVAVTSDDEIGLLSKDINNMLESINQRDIRLQTELDHRKEIEEKLQFLAHYDKNTMLLNRHAFEEAITKKITTQPPDERNHIYLLLLDLDRFKIVNDSFGHPTGDKLLQQVAHRLRGNLSQEDAIFRLGGDEFAIIIDASGHSTIEQVCKRVIQTISSPFIVDDHEIHIGISIGIATLRPGFDSKIEVMKNADMALYQAKDAGRNTYRFYSEENETSTSELRTLREELHFSLQNQELELYYQPIIHTQLLKTIGFEALLRWRHPTRGVLTPDQFIHLAEGSGLIISIGAWVIHQALKQLAMWQQTFDQDLFMNVNISSRQLDDDSLSDTIRHALDFYQVAPRTLNLEITESMVMRNIESAKHILYALKQLGIGIAIDDFGIGHSSMNYLKQLPVDVLKIDKQFTAGIPHDKVDIAIVDALVALAVSLNLKVVAEGVENAIQFEYLQYKLCHHVQGYLFSAALSASQTTAFLADFPESIPAVFRKIMQPES
ncbi:diguanylate cyclase (GGDEF) domain-containing protein [Methylophilus rhizosphaerae]|uniref:Diguanylate cyclase (GGDEF) domain-containing protein n=1 Tax=Methylophilus rhizosphaerae TaxID=492660 RepID=A0A1G9CT98_9PROT|nr:EAL domain-containing protein [Methylophilus rhizosphaerae]SDK54882.1 diguanylate cyclase (GGDEF) domain-containing protein [Methylophilus rhizosphaerae]